MVKLAVKNETGGELEIRSGGAAPIRIAPGATKDLDAGLLKSQAVTDLLHGRKISLQPPYLPAHPTKEQEQTFAEQMKLAREVLAPMVTTLGAQILNHRNRYVQSQRELVRLRDAYNKSWIAAEAGLAAAKAAAESWGAVHKAITTVLIDTTPEPKEVTEKREAVEKLQQELADMAKDPVAAADLDAWFERRLAKQKELAAAKAELDALAKQKSDPLVAEMNTVSKHSDTVTDLAKKKDKAIGKELPELAPIPDLT
jgi:hypothetical protein